MEIENPFKIKDEAKRYQNFRPMYHHLPFNLIKDFLGGEIKMALDVACGTGHSSFALSKISDHVIGCDLSKTMLEEAKNNYDLDFVESPAENLPFDDSAFDLINISMGFHWLKQEEFLREAKRLLKNNGHLCIDSYGFCGVISKDGDEQESHNKLFQTYLPAASRRSAYPEEEQIKKASLKLVKEFTYSHEIEMTKDEFINLIKTWSNFQIKSDEEKEITSNKMEEVYSSIFKDKKLSLGFRGKSILLGRS